MSISRKTRRSLTDGNRALQLFTDRHELTRIFAEYINDEVSSEKILFFHGDGGNGKSLLLKFLQKHFCKCFRSDIWQELKTKADAQVAEFTELAESAEFERVPAILHDFGLRPNGDEQPQDPFYGLLMLRRSLSRAATELGYNLRFPLYDFGCIWYLQQKNLLTSDKLKELFPAEEIDFLLEIFDAVSQTALGAIGRAAIAIFSKYMQGNFLWYLQRKGLKEEDVREIRQMDAETELINELPRLFAEDLNAAMSQPKAPARIVLFFDSHEAFWGSQRHLEATLFFQRDEWLRYLLAELELKAGIVAVVAGRELPRWNEADNFPIPQKYLDTQLVSHLSPNDADDYLQRAGISDDTLRQSLLAYASVAADQMHPFLLGLCADVVLQEIGEGGKCSFLAANFNATLEEKAEKLINRLLKYVTREISYAVHALSACRTFNFPLYRLLGQALDFFPTKPAFNMLTEFSFVWDVQQLGKHWYRIHDLLRRLNYEGGNEVTQQAHSILEKYYREQGELAEAIYHANRLDWQRGVKEWLKEFDWALQHSCYEKCRSLIEIRSDLVIKSYFYLGKISRAEGDYFAQLARYVEAQQEYLEAVAAYDQHLNITPDDPITLNNKGNVLSKMGKLQTQLSLHPQSLQSYRDAIAVYNSALTHAPHYINALNNKGVALQNLGYLQTQLFQPTEALQSYREAITAFSFAPDDIYALNNKGNALISLGDLQTRLAKHTQALQSYTQAIATYNITLNLAPNYIDALNNKGNALSKIGQLEALLSLHSQALQSYSDAIAAYNSALNLAPDYIQIINNKGVVLQRLGDLQTRLTQQAQALQSYHDAIATYNSVLNLAPDYIYALNNKGTALQNLGYLQTQLNQHLQALQSYSDAIATYNNALYLAPDYIYALNNKGLVLSKIGQLCLKFSQQQEALQSWQASLAALNRSLEIAPGDQDTRNFSQQLQAVLDDLG